ncbi:MAG: hypothetical protein RL748_1014 [Pseudomonadota bacterium]|jgi:hypothetical protein
MILSIPTLKNIIAFSLFFFLKLAMAVPTESIAAKLKAFTSIEAQILSDQSMSATEQGKKFVATYKALFHQDKTPATFDDLGAEDLEVLFLAASKAAFYSNSVPITGEMHAIFQKLHSAPQAKPAHLSTMYTALLAARMLPEAQKFLAQYPGASSTPFPEFQTAKNIASANASEWSISSDGKTVTHQALDIGNGAQVLVISYPDCHFSQNAAKAITANLKLRDLLKGHMKWVAPQSRNFDVGTIRQWNLDYSDFPMTIIYKQDDMPMIDYWGTPGFYFFKNGALKTKVIGWPREGRVNELMAGLKTIGIE